MAFQAGAIPNATPVSKETASTNSNTWPSTLTLSSLGIASGLIAARTRTPNTASSRPAPPPNNASVRLSVRNWRNISQRPAPRAVRSAISSRREAARASSMWLTLAQAISSTKPTAPRSTSRAGRMSPTTFSRSERTCMSWLVPGNSRSSRLVMVAISAWACSRVTPGFNRANTRSEPPSRSARREPRARGAQSPAFVAQKGANLKSRGITPITV